MTLSNLRFIENELNRVASSVKLKREGARTFICCPFHTEKTPSLLINLSTNSRYPAGSFKCMGCGEHGGWRKLADALGLRTPDNKGKAEVYEEAFFNGRLDQHDSPDIVPKDKIKDSLGLVAIGRQDKEWRGLPASYLTDVGGELVEGKGGNRFLYFPCSVDGVVVGGIRAMLDVKEGEKTIGVKYKNSPGEWSRNDGLYPYDYTAMLLDKFQKKHGFRGLCVVEGARDSLTLNYHGIPTVGILGTQSWGSIKHNRLLDLEPDFVLICMDGDNAGRKSELTLFNDMVSHLPCRRMNLTRFNSECGFEVDPGNAPDWVIQEILKAVVRRRPQHE